MASNNPFIGRTLAVIDDLTVDERLYLFRHAATIKKGLRDGQRDTLKPYRIADTDFGIALVFLEDSTRTKESFRNAAEFHQARVSMFDATHSSFNKKECYADAFNMLTGYGNQIFVVRSKLEGVCRWLEENGRAYAERNNVQPPAFINAGDGRHEHPTQELLDGFTFLEQLDHQKDHIHVALIGDLLHGRTAHSKAEGLKIFDNVKVDLVAPPELGMPDYYVRKMEANGFGVRVWESLDAYVADGCLATHWYFTRPQLERMGDEVLRRQDELREAITFKESFMASLSKDTRFYHPLPRHREHPTIPFWLDDTHLNGWEEQSANGYIMRTALLSAIAGRIGEDFDGKAREWYKSPDDFIERITVDGKAAKDIREGIMPIQSGVVIDHICKGESPDKIQQHLRTVRKVLGIDGKYFEGVTQSGNGSYKAIVSIPQGEDLSERAMKRLAAVAPGCTLNQIVDGRVVQKLRLHMPPRIYGFEDTSCSNEACISRPEHAEPMTARFHRLDDRFLCDYCHMPHEFRMIWTE
jgi:aspartate carbamoyltransferase